MIDSTFSCYDLTLSNLNFYSYGFIEIRGEKQSKSQNNIFFENCYFSFIKQTFAVETSNFILIENINANLVMKNCSYVSNIFGIFFIKHMKF